MDFSKLRLSSFKSFVEPKEIEFDNQITSSLNNTKIPGWMKIVVEWWENGEIDDGTYLNIIQFLLDEGIIKQT